MVGGGIFAVTGLTIQLTRGAAPLAFIVAGGVALLTSYSYLKLTLRYPSGGGTITFLNRAYGTGLLTGASSILLCLSYVVLLAVYAFAFASYARSFLPADAHAFWHPVFLNSVVVALVVVNLVGPGLVIRSGNWMNLTKVLLLLLFVGAGLSTPVDWSRLAPSEFVSPVPLVAGAMVIFLNYEGFELIANAAREVRDPRKTLPIAYLGGVLLAMLLYVLIAIVVVGHLSVADVAKHSDYSLSVAARDFMGRPGFAVIGVAALLATSSAINATFYSSGRLVYTIARSGYLPAELERKVRGESIEGMLIFAGLTLVVGNFVPLGAIATMGSAGFLLIFLLVNLAAVKLYRETGGSRAISAAGVLATALALGVLCVETEENPTSRYQIWILLGMIGASCVVELIYRGVTRREVHAEHPSSS